MAFESFAKRILRRFGIQVERLRARPIWPGDTDRFSYQRLYTTFDISLEDRVLDIGSGASPFPYATVLLDRYLEPTAHRHGVVAKDSRPLVIADVSTLPFQNKCFDFVYCAHVLEHVDDPIKSCSEIMRVGQRGYVETPTLAKDMLFSWAQTTHKWHIVSIADILVFFERSERQAQGIRSATWRDIMLGRFYHPLQEAFYKNQDIFNVMFKWDGSFSVMVFRLDGTISTLSSRDLSMCPPQDETRGLQIT